MNTLTRYIITVVITTATVGGATYAVVKQKQATNEAALQNKVTALENQVKSLTEESETPIGDKETTTLSNDEIFQEASVDLGLKRSNLIYFRIFGQDRIQYSVGTTPAGSGTTFAYKTSAEWKVAGPENQQGLPKCDTVASVPEKYRPPCLDGNMFRYTSEVTGGSSVNYPPSQKVSYIGE